jgi:hypothetical protein
MPDVGLTSSAEPLKEEYKVVVKYTIEIEGLPIYTESYDAAKLRKGSETDEQTLREYWFRRVECVIGDWRAGLRQPKMGAAPSR